MFKTEDCRSTVDLLVTAKVRISEHKPDGLEQQKTAPGALMSGKSHGLTKTAQQEIRKGCLVSWVLISAVTSRWQGPKWP